MAGIFISHSSRDNEAAADVAARLKAEGYHSLFLDFSPEDGIPAGREWEREVYLRLRQCQTVIVLCSRASMASQWCFAEITHAKALGKHVIPIRIDDCDVAQILHDRQILDLRSREEADYERLWASLKAHGLDPRAALQWDARRPPYPGLLSFQEADGALFFGRDEAIRDGLDALNRQRQFGGARVLVVLGASGSGKSSLVRAGLIPRLRRDPERWCVLDPISLQGDLVSALSSALARAYVRHRDERDPEVLLASLTEAAGSSDPQRRTEILRKLAVDLIRAADTPEARILLMVDQAEELLGDTSSLASLVLLRSLAECPGWRCLVTLRSDFLGEFQRHPALREMAFESHPLGPLTAAGLRQVVMGPAEIAGLDFEDDLCERLVQDALEQDALPLLAFALREIWERRESGGRMRLQVYRRDLGGLAGAVARTAEEVVSAARPSAAVEDALRRSFLSLTRLAEDGRYSRRTRRWAEIEPLAKPLLERFVAARLLVSRGDGAVGVVEVAHEALFRSWDRLSQWLEENRHLLQALARLERAARRWKQEGEHRDFLLPAGRPLSEAQGFLESSAAELSEDERRFVTASVAAREEALDAQRQAEERRRRRSRQLAMATLGVLVLALALGVAVWMYAETRSAREQAVSERDLADRARAEAEVARRQTETLRSAYQARSLAVTSEGGNPAALLEALRAAVPDLAEHGRPHPEAEAALRLAVSRMERVLPLTGHVGAISHAAWSANGERLISASRDGTARIWSSGTGRAEQVLRGHAGRVLHAAFSPTGTTALTASADRTAALWDVETGVRRHVLERHDDHVAFAAFSRDASIVVTTSWDARAILWDPVDGALLHELTGHEGRVVHASFSRGGDRVATASWDGTARLWDTSTGSAGPVLAGHQGAVRQVAFSPDDAHLVTASADGTARVWRTADGSLVHVLEGHGRGVRAVEYSRDGSLIVTGSGDGTSRLWSASDGAAVRTFEGHTAPLTSATFAPSGRIVVSASTDGSVRIWRVDDGSLADVYGGDGTRILGAHFAPGQDRIVFYGDDHAARIWNTHASSLLFALGGHTDLVNTVAFSGCGTFALTASDDGTAMVWRTEDGHLVSTHRGHGAPIMAARFLPGARQVVTGSVDGSARVWSTETGSLAHVLPQGGPAYDVAVSPDGSRIAVSSDHSTSLWGVEDGTIEARLLGHTNAPNGVAFSPEGSKLVTASIDATARLWGVDGTPLRTLEGHTERVNQAVFSPDGSRVGTASDDHTARIWDVGSGDLAAVLKGHAYRVLCLSFSPDGMHVVTGSADDTARIWSLAPVPVLEHVLPHGDDVVAVAFAPDGERVATASRDGAASVWSLESGTLLERLGEGEDYVVDVAFSPDGGRLLTASAEAGLWSIGIEDLLSRARLLAGPHLDSSNLSPESLNWLRAQSWEPLSRGERGLDDRRLAAHSLIEFHDTFAQAAEEAQRTGRLIFCVFSRYNPP